MATLPTDETYLGKIRRGSRVLMLANRLQQGVEVQGNAENGFAELFLQGNTVFSLTRPSPGYFVEDLKWLRAYDDLRADRELEIFQQLGDVFSFFGAQTMLDDGRRGKSLAYLSAVQGLAIFVHTQFKYFCRAIRPIDMAMEVQPMIQTPDHSSFPSGHSTEAFAIATALYRLLTGQSAAHGIAGSALPFRLAHRIAANRTVAGVHFPVDSFAGALLGCQIGEVAYALATNGTVENISVTIPHNDGDATPDFLLDNRLLAAMTSQSTVAAASDPVVTHMYNEALDEWPR